MSVPVSLPFTLAVYVLFTAQALAAGSVISGRLRAGTPTIASIENDFCPNEQLPYDIVGPFTVSATGTYTINDSGYTEFSQDTVITIYNAMPNPGNPLANRVGGSDDLGSVNLSTGTQYYVLAQPWCFVDTSRNGAWSQQFEGQGVLTGDAVVSPDFWSGEFTANDGQTLTTTDSGCPQTYYDVSGPHRLSRAGTWYISSTRQYTWFDFGPDLHFALYEGAFAPGSPAVNRVYEGLGGPVDNLKTGTDYFIVTQPYCEVRTGPWSFVLWPPALYELNGASSGAYYYAPTSGQGQLVAINPETLTVFLAWFTWATNADVIAETAQQVGDVNQRWLTMLGNYELGDDSVELDVYSSAGGTFNDQKADPATKVGTAVMDMSSCTEGELRYDLDSGESGTAPMNFLVSDVSQCEANYAGPGVLYK